MPSLRGSSAKVLVRTLMLLMLGSHGPVKYQRFLFNSVVPLLALKVKGVGSEPADVPGIPAEWLIPDKAASDKVLLYLHGGGYVIGNINSHRAMVSQIAMAAGCRALMIEYRLAPEHKLPAAVEDAASAYRWLLAQGYEPGNVVIAGDSAGGGLTAATLVYLRDAGDPPPAAAMMLSPWADLEVTGESCRTVGRRDPMVKSDHLKRWAVMYLGGKEPRDPLASPIHADLTGLPPLLIHVGTCEVLLDDARRLAEKAREDGVPVELYECDGMFHVWQFFSPMVPESKDAVQRLGRFYRDKVGV
ncbi:MAG: alpha/beta hydrolase [Actinomycetota bacterium]